MFYFETGKVKEDFAVFAQAKGAAGVIIATQPTDSIELGSVDMACAYVDYELGMDILLYIQTTKYTSPPSHFSLKSNYGIF